MIRSIRLNTIGLLVALLTFSTTALAGDICSAILANGTFDEHDSYTAGQQFMLVYNALCKSEVTTYQGATATNSNLGGSLIGVVDATLGVTTDSSNFADHRTKFCSMDYTQVSGSSTVITKVRVASKAITAAWDDCVTHFQGFVAWVTEAKTLDAFTISMQNNTDQGNYAITSISHPNGDIKCELSAQDSTPQKPLSESTRFASISCSKDPSKTIQVSMNTSAGVLEPVDIAGSDTVLQDLIDRLNALQAASTELPVGTIIAWYATNGRVPDGWAICDGANGTPDLRSRYIQGVGTFADVSASPIGSDTHTHSFVTQDAFNRAAGNVYHVTSGGPPQTVGLDLRLRGTTDPASNIPPSIKLLYIMKLPKA